jgi:hypothetical protein
MNYSWSTPKRFTWDFLTLAAAEQFAADKRADGCKDVVVIIIRNAEDLCRDEFFKSRVNGAKVVWTEETTD